MLKMKSLIRKSRLILILAAGFYGLPSTAWCYSFEQYITIKAAIEKGAVEEISALIQGGVPVVGLPHDVPVINLPDGRTFRDTLSDPWHLALFTGNRNIVRAVLISPDLTDSVIEGEIEYLRSMLANDHSSSQAIRTRILRKIDLLKKALKDRTIS